MKFRRWTFTAALVGAAVWLTCTAFTQDAQDTGAAGAAGGTPEADAMASMQEGMKKWMESCRPGKQHQKLARLIGKWDTEFAMYGMGATPMKSPGTAEFSWLFDGRWLQERWTGSMMGMPVSGLAIIGYDNFKQKYTTATVNSLDTMLLTAEGNFDQSGDALISYGVMDEPMTGENDKMVKYVMRFQGDDKLTFEIHDLAIGETNTKVIEITFTRQK
jgi:hypothetical protein